MFRQYFIWSELLTQPRTCPWLGIFSVTKKSDSSDLIENGLRELEFSLIISCSFLLDVIQPYNTDL